MDARKFWTACRIHDWYYMYSDDPGVYREGREADEALRRMTDGKPELKAIYDAWEAHHFSSGARPAEPKLDDA